MIHVYLLVIPAFSFNIDPKIRGTSYICHARKSSSTAAVPWRRVELVAAPGGAQLVGVGVVVPMIHGTSTVDPEMEQAHFPRRLNGYPVSNMAGKSNQLMMA
jgi:hypothetical protein